MRALVILLFLASCQRQTLTRTEPTPTSTKAAPTSAAATTPSSTSAPAVSQATTLAASDCAPERLVRRGTLNTWKRALEDAFTHKDDEPRSKTQSMKLNALLQEVGLSLSAEELNPTNGCTQPELREIEIISANLSAAKAPYQIVAVHIDVCNDALLHNTGASLVQVLAPAGEGAMCQVPGDLTSYTMGDACLSSAQYDKQENPLAITPVNLLSADHQDLQVVSEDGRCDDYYEREGHFKTSLWTLRDNAMKKIFEADTFDTIYQSPTPPTEWFDATLSLEGGFPKALRLTGAVVCYPLDEPGTTGSDCKPSKKMSRYAFDGSEYKEKK